MSAQLKAQGPDFGLGCFCFRSSSKANCLVLCVLVSKNEVGFALPYFAAALLCVLRAGSERACVHCCTCCAAVLRHDVCVYGALLRMLTNACWWLHGVQVANIRCEESSDGTVLVHDLKATPIPFSNMNAVLKYFADPTSEFNNKVPISFAIPPPDVSGSRRSSNIKRKGSVYNGFDTSNVDV